MTTMLKVGLGVLRQHRRLPVDEEVPADDALWDGLDLTLARPVRMRGTAELRGNDVVVRARLVGEAVTSCRRCLQPVRVPVDEQVVFVYWPGLTEAEAQAQEVYPLSDRARELDLTAAVREHVLLAVPQFVICDETCRGLCPQCGADLNRSACACRAEVVDVRWAALERFSNE